MKKLIPVILCCAMLLAACGSSGEQLQLLRRLCPRRKREHFFCRIF